MGCGALILDCAPCTGWVAQGSDSESDATCSRSENGSTIGAGSDGTTVGVYRITVPRIDEESSVDRRLNLVARDLCKDGESARLRSFELVPLVSSVEGGEEDALGNNEGVVRSISCSVVGTVARINSGVLGSRR